MNTQNKDFQLHTIPLTMGYEPMTATSPCGPDRAILDVNGMSFGSYLDSESEERKKIGYHLSNLFPGERVRQVMQAHPDENDVHDLCKYLIDIQFKS